MKRVLLHICCGVCAFGAIERLRNEGYAVCGFFYNPNIHPREEYDKRLEVIEAVRRSMGVDVAIGEYDTGRWRAACDIYKDEPEGGSRCRECFIMRLFETARRARQDNFDYFTTTLTISPHKKSSLVFAAGEQAGGEKFLKIDFKKKEGFKRTNELAKKYGVYHQDYCGCVYSQRAKSEARNPKFEIKK